MKQAIYEAIITILVILVGSLGLYNHIIHRQLNGARLSAKYANAQANSYKQKWQQAEATLSSDSSEISSLTRSNTLNKDAALFAQTNNGFLQDEADNAQSQLFQDQTNTGQ